MSSSDQSILTVQLLDEYQFFFVVSSTSSFIEYEHLSVQTDTSDMFDYIQLRSEMDIFT